MRSDASPVDMIVLSVVLAGGLASLGIVYLGAAKTTAVGLIVAAMYLYAMTSAWMAARSTRRLQ